jgi:glyceraldehyde 3-phosphate dehydrogenase
MGRIGKALLRLALKDPRLNVVWINELRVNRQNIAYTINYDSTYGSLEDKFIVDGEFIKNSKDTIYLTHTKDIATLDLSSFDVDIFIDASGAKIDKATLDLLSVQKVFLTHPNKKADKNVILGVNEQELLDPKNKIIAASSCNATALLPVLYAIEQEYGIEYGDITTIHPLLNHQKTLDSGCIGSSDRDIECNFEFGRSATQNIIPSRTTTIDACSLVMPNINKQTISSNSFRVPTATVGAINIAISVQKYITQKTIQELFDTLQKQQQYPIFYNSYDPLVSSDFQSSLFTSIIDHRFTEVLHNKMVKLVIWYDNEWGYASKVLEMVKYKL